MERSQKREEENIRISRSVFSKSFSSSARAWNLSSMSLEESSAGIAKDRMGLLTERGGGDEKERCSGVRRQLEAKARGERRLGAKKFGGQMLIAEAEEANLPLCDATRQAATNAMR